LQIFVGWNNPATRPIQHPDLHLPNIAGGAHDFVENQLSAPFPTSFQVDIDGQFRPIDDSASTNLHGPGSISDAGADEEG
jgi:hypothetical protein